MSERKPFIVVPEVLADEMRKLCGPSVDVLPNLPLPPMPEYGSKEWWAAVEADGHPQGE